MARILLTGGTGYLGSRLLPRLAAAHRVVSLARQPQPLDLPVTTVRGDFTRDDDLRALDPHPVDELVHLAAVTGGAGEEEALMVNVVGTRRLLRYLLDRGCRKFVLASTIAVPGCRDARCLPARLPVPPDHLCQAREGYGLSKWLVEQLAGYFHDCQADADFTILRIGTVMDDTTGRTKVPPDFEFRLPFLYLGRVFCSDVLAGLTLAAGAAPRPGVRHAHLVGPDVYSREPVAAVLRRFLGPRAAALDLRYHETPGLEFAPVYDLTSACADLGYAPARSVRAAALASSNPHS